MNTPESQRRWRLILGASAEMSIKGGTRNGNTGTPLYSLDPTDIKIDETLEKLYGRNQKDKDGPRSAGLGGSSPQVARWLGDIRTYFPSSVVSIMQKDAIERLDLKKLLFEPEILSTVTPDVNLVATLVSLGSALPSKSKATARQVVQKVCERVLQRIEQPTREAIAGSVNRGKKNLRPRHNEIDWLRTIKRNLKHYQSQYQTIIPERLVGYGRKRTSLQDIIIVVDESGSMAPSVVYASIFAAVMASIPSVSTRFIAFDTNVADLSDKLADPVEVIFGTQLGGGTDINQAMSYAQTLVTRPSDTVMILISDLYEGGNRAELLKRIWRIKGMGVNLITLLAINDDGAPAYDKDMAMAFAQMDIPTFATTPDAFPPLIGAALARRSLTDQRL